MWFSIATPYAWDAAWPGLKEDTILLALYLQSKETSSWRGSFAPVSRFYSTTHFLLLAMSSSFNELVFVAATLVSLWRWLLAGGGISSELSMMFALCGPIDVSCIAEASNILIAAPRPFPSQDL